MKFLTKILAGINIAIVLGLWITGFLSGLSPVTWGWLGLLGYAFPFFLVATICMMVMWIFFRKRYILMSFLGLLVAYYPVTLYCPVNIQEKGNDKNTLKVMSYNTCEWGIGYKNKNLDLTNEEKYHIMIDYFKSVDADIVALQESSINDNLDTLKTIYHYTDTLNPMSKERCAIQLMSKYPITRKENFHFESVCNGAGAFWINYKGKEIIVIAAHLESMGFSAEDKEGFSTMMHGKNEDRDSVKKTSKTIFRKILIATKKRSVQAEKIATFIDAHLRTPIIVMGDFNDIPQSFTHSLISDNLTDCYHEKGLGPGYSFRHFGMRIRIDNILCSDYFTPVSCKVDPNIELSDHLPIIATLRVDK